MRNSWSKVAWNLRNERLPSAIQACIPFARRFAVLAVVMSCFAGCVDLTEPWKHLSATGGVDGGGHGGAGGAGEEDGALPESGEDGAIDAAAGGRGGLTDTGLGGTGGSVDLGESGTVGTGGVIDATIGGIGEVIDAFIGGTGGVIDAPLGGTGGMLSIGGTGGVIDASVGDTGDAARDERIKDSGEVGIDVGGAGGTALGGAGGTIIGTGGAVTGGTSGGTGGVATGGAGGTDTLIAYYACNETSGTTLADSSGNSNNGNLKDIGTNIGYGFGAGRSANSGNALVLNSAGSGYVEMPSGVLTALSGASEMTIATWVYITSSESWQRIFDIGSSANTSPNDTSNTTNIYMNLVPADSFGNTAFSITNSGLGGQSSLSGSGIPINTWTHVAVVIGGGNGELYINGAVANTNTISCTPKDLGTLGYAYIGKSGFSDPFLDGKIDDFRVYSRALSASEVQAIFQFTGH